MSLNFSPSGSPIQLNIDFGNGESLTLNRPAIIDQYVDGIIPLSSTLSAAESQDEAAEASGEGEELGSEAIEDSVRKKREINDDEDEGSGEVHDYDDISDRILSAMDSPNEDFVVNYTYGNAGQYNVKVEVRNKFGTKSSHLCPDIVVIPQDFQDVRCIEFNVNVLNVSSEADPMLKLRSEEIAIFSEAVTNCVVNNGYESEVRYTWQTDWETDLKTWRPELEVCVTEDSSPVLTILPNTLWYGTYRLKVTAS